MSATRNFGFRIVGGVGGPRELIDLDRALVAYAACVREADVARESYLSAFGFGRDFREHMDTQGTPRGFQGSCWSPWLWCDLDAPDLLLEPVLAQARALVGAAGERYALDDGEVLVFFSGRKGFCVGLPAPASAAPSADFNKIARVYAESLAALAGARLDPATFTKVQPLRAPNSRHPRSGLHKVRLEAGELLGLKLERILELARDPRPFDWYAGTCDHPQALADWEEAVRVVGASPKGARRRGEPAGSRLNRQTLEFIRHGAEVGDRHRLLFSAAANLAELGCSFELASALLSPAALDSGLPPREVERQIRCGLDHVLKQEGPQ